MDDLEAAAFEAAPHLDAEGTRDGLAVARRRLTVGLRGLGLLLLLLLSGRPPQAQTNISVPSASGTGIKFVLPGSSSGRVFGINLDDSYYYGNNQLTANLTSSFNLSFQRQTWSQVATCTAGTTTTWTDSAVGSQQPANFWQGATYQVVSGVNAGKTGTITSSAPSAGSIGQIFTLSPSLTSACSTSGGGDQMLLRCRNAGGACAGGYTPANASLGIRATGSGSASFETTDVSPSSSSPQGLVMAAPGASTASIAIPIDALVAGHSYMNFSGTYTLTFRAKGVAGGPTISYTVSRVGAPALLGGIVFPVINPNPGTGWTNYSTSFSPGESGGQSQTGYLTITATGGTVLIQDVALTENPVAGNTTVFRNAVFQRLQALKPGILRFMTNSQYGCSFDNMIAGSSGRTLCGSNAYLQFGQPVAYGLNDFLNLAKAVGADPWWTFSAFSTPTDMANIAAYMSGTCGNGNAYTAVRCNSGQTAPWTSVFNHIYLEMGNEVWNTAVGGSIYAAGGSAYGALLANNVAAFKASPFYTNNMKIVGSGFAVQSNGPYGWNASVLTAAQTVPNGLPDYIDGAPYMFSYLTDTSSNQNIFGPMFAEPVNFTSVATGVTNTGSTYFLQNYANSTFGVQGAIYETNMGTACGLAGISQATINGVVGGVGAGLDATMNMLLSVRDAGVKVINFFALPEPANAFYTATSTTSGSCNTGGSLYNPLWGMNKIMPGPTNAAAIDRPTGIALQMVNAAMESKLNVLNVVQQGTPTYIQPDAQPNPSYYLKPGANSIAANQAVPFVQAFGFGDGSGNYSLIVYNLSLTNSQAITFSGSAAPVGTVTKTVFTSANITDNNESATIGSVPVVGIPSPTTLSNPSGDTLPPFSMTTYTWVSNSVPPTVTVTSSANSSVYGQRITLTAQLTGSSAVPTGTVVFMNGSNAMGTATLVPSNTASFTSIATFITSALAVGTDPVTVTYAATPGFGDATSSILNQIVTPATPLATVISSQSSSLYGQPVTLTATLSGGYLAPTGPVIFMDGANAIGTATLASNAASSTSTATFTTTTLPVGTNSITVTYPASSNFFAVASPAISEIIQPIVSIPKDFTIALAATSAAIGTHHNLTTVVRLTSVGGFADTVTLTCGNLPTYVTCRPIPSDATLGANGITTAALYIDTNSVLGYAYNDSGPRRGPGLPINLALLLSPVGLFAGLAFVPRRSRHTSLRLLVLFFAILPMTLPLAGCGNNTYPTGTPPSTSAGTYTIPITSTGTSTGITHTVSLTLTVMP